MNMDKIDRKLNTIHLNLLLTSEGFEKASEIGYNESKDIFFQIEAWKAGAFTNFKLVGGIGSVV